MADVMDTAAAVSRLRADEARLPPGSRLFDDPYAELFAGGPELDELFARFVSVPFMREQIRLRTRFIDDAVRAGLASGIAQVVLLGVGFDCRALRMAEIAERALPVFEVDFAPQLERKRAILDAAGVRVPERVKSIACDLVDEGFVAPLANALVGAGFRRGEAAMFVWEGVVGYIDDPVVERTLGFVRSIGGGSSRVVLNYPLGRFTGGRLAELLEAAGLVLLEESSLDLVHRRHLPGEPPPGGDLFRVAVARVV